MKKILLTIFIIAFLVLGIALEGDCGLNPWGRTDLNRLLGKVVPGYLQSVGTGMISGITSLTSAIVAIPLSYAVVRKVITDDLTLQAGTLADGTLGQLLKIYITWDEGLGSGEYLLTPDTCALFTSILFNAAKDEVTLLYVDDIVGWIIIGSESIDVYGPHHGEY